MTLTNILIIIAVLLGPFLGVFTQKTLEKLREKKQAKLNVFWTLMATRGMPLSIEHIRALNTIDLVFSEERNIFGKIKKNDQEAEARIKWKDYLDHLGRYPKDSTEIENDLRSWTTDSDDKLADLLQVMGNSLKYHYDLDLIKKRAYYPKRYQDIDIQNEILRLGVINLLKKINDATLQKPSQEGAEYTEKFKKMLYDFLDGERDFTVVVKNASVDITD